MEYLDIVDENGQPTGRAAARDDAHRDALPHRTAHVWIVRRHSGRTEVLLQKRGMEKESYPGLWDTSSAGHIPAGDEPVVSALRELREELGISAAPEQLIPAGTFRTRWEKEFHGRLFRDNEFTFVYVYAQPVDAARLALQASEVDAVRWFALEEVAEEIRGGSSRFCVPTAGLAVLAERLKQGDIALPEG